MSGPFSRVVEAVALIASKLGATVTSSGNRLADNLEGIAEAVSGGGSGAEITVVTYYMTVDATLSKGSTNWVSFEQASEDQTVPEEWKAAVISKVQLGLDSGDNAVMIGFNSSFGSPDILVCNISDKTITVHKESSEVNVVYFS